MVVFKTWFKFDDKDSKVPRELKIRFLKIALASRKDAYVPITFPGSLAGNTAPHFFFSALLSCFSLYI